MDREYLAELIRRNVEDFDGQEFSLVIELMPERRESDGGREVQPSEGCGSDGPGTAAVQQ